VKTVMDYRRVRPRLLNIGFVTLQEYLTKLEQCCHSLASIGPRGMLYLAAAVSDFYITDEDLSTHKIQSSAGAVTLKLSVVPKLLHQIVHDWTPRAFVISFKLETDSTILLEKAKKALLTYGHQLVICNELSTRQRQVTFLTLSDQHPLRLSDEQVSMNMDIEKVIVDNIAILHDNHLSSHK